MRSVFIPVIATSIAVAACADLPTDPGGHGPGRLPAATAELTAAESQLVVCPTAETRRARATVGPEGGYVSARGSSITIPPGAVSEPTLFEVVVPASRYMEIEIHAAGMDSYVFATPATITINFARCPGDAIPPGSVLEGVYIDDVNQVLEHMGGQSSSHKLSFQTGHLSGYAVAY